MEEYGAILGSKEATVFTQSLHKLQLYYETRDQELNSLRQQLEAEQQQVTAKLQFFKLLNASGADSLAVTQAVLEPTPPLALKQSQQNSTTESKAKEYLAEVATAIQSETVSPLPTPSAESSNRRNTQSTRRKRSKTLTEIAPVAETSDVDSEDATASEKEVKDELTSAKRKEFRNLSPLDAIAKVLKEAGEPTHIDDIVNRLYKKLNAAQQKLAKHRVNNALSRGKKAARWQNVDGRPGYYIISPGGQTEGLESASA